MSAWEALKVLKQPHEHKCLVDVAPFGIVVDHVEEIEKGHEPARVSWVSPGSSAARQGVQRGMVLVEVNGEEVDAETWLGKFQLLEPPFEVAFETQEALQALQALKDAFAKGLLQERPDVRSLLADHYRDPQAIQQVEKAMLATIQARAKLGLVGAATSLHWRQKDAQPLVGLAQLFQDPQIARRTSCEQAAAYVVQYGQIGPHGPVLVLAVCQLLRDPSARLRKKALLACGDLCERGHVSKSTGPALAAVLVQLIADLDPQVRLGSAIAIVPLILQHQCGPHSDALIEALEDELVSEDDPDARAFLDDALRPLLALGGRELTATPAGDRRSMAAKGAIPSRKATFSL